MPDVRLWCEHCRDHFDVDHYDDLIAPDDDSPCTGGGHKAGVEYGDYGRLLAIEQVARQICAARPSTGLVSPMGFFAGLQDLAKLVNGDA